MRKMTPAKIRFFRMVSKRKRKGGCWLWMGTCTPGGYGSFGRGRKEDGKEMAHRFSWMIHKGPIPNGLFVLHKCDTTKCVNPKHLFLGTQADNVRDAKLKGRMASGKRWHAAKRATCQGSRHGMSKLREKDIPKIRKLHAGGMSMTSIAVKFRVTRKNISNIVNGRNWTHVA